MPAKTIADNAGVEGAVIVGKLLESDETSDYGYNAAKGAQCESPPWMDREKPLARGICS